MRTSSPKLAAALSKIDLVVRDLVAMRNVPVNATDKPRLIGEAEELFEQLFRFRSKVEHSQVT